MALNSTADINTYVQMAQDAGPGVINPELFYCKQLLDTIRLDADQYVYYRLADTTPIQDKADKLQVRRWSPLQAHTIPLVEGVPPTSDKGSVEKYEIPANQYGRYMEFTDKVDFKMVDPIVAHYTKEYSLVAMETLDMLARETLMSVANKHFAGSVADYENLTVDSKPSMNDLRLIILSMKKKLVKPRNNGKYQVIASPEFYFDMLDDPLVKQYMTVNQTTSGMYDNGVLPPMFEMEFYETQACPVSAEFPDAGGTTQLRVYETSGSTPTYKTITQSTTFSGNKKVYNKASGYVNDSRTGKPASYIPDQVTWDLDGYNADTTAAGNKTWKEFKFTHVLIVGKDALIRTGIQGEDNAKMYVKQKGTSGVIDPLDQRQSIGFKINSVGFGSARLEAVVDYICVPTQSNI